MRGRWRGRSLVSLISDLLTWIDCDTVLASPPDGVISITATGQTLQIGTVLLSYAFSATNGLRITWDGMSTVITTLRILRLFQFNATHCFSAKHSPLLGNAFFVCLIQTSHQVQGFISFWTSGAGKSIYKNTLESRRKRDTVEGGCYPRFVPKPRIETRLCLRGKTSL